jgi:hypothetical protein
VTSVDVGQNLVTAAETFRTKTEAAPDVTPPGIVAGPTVGAQVLAQGLVTATIEWVTDEPANSFVVFGTDPSLGSRAGSGELVAVHRVSLPNLTPGVEVFYRVGSEDASGNQSALSEQVSFIPLADVEAPVMPVGLVAFGGNEQVRLVWRRNVEADFAGYTLQRSVAGGAFTPIATGVADTVYLDSGVPNDAEIAYQLSAVDLAGNSSDAAEVATTPAVTNVPTEPVAVVAGPLDGEGRVRTQTPNLVIDNAVPGQARPGEPLTYTFAVYRDADLTEVVTSIAGITEDVFVAYDQAYDLREAGADSGQTVWKVTPPLGAPPPEEGPVQYWWRSRANDGVFDGPWSAAGTFAVAPGVAVELTFFAGRAEGQTVVLEWTAMSDGGDVGFHVYRGGTADGAYQRLTPAPVHGQGTYRWTDQRMAIDRTYFYKLEVVEFGGAGTFYGPVAVHVAAPKAFVLEPNAPNPFNPQTMIRYQVPVTSHLSLKIYNVLGQAVATLVDGEVPAGYHTVVWDGRDTAHRPVASGIYFYRLESEKFTTTRKMLLLK